LSVTISAFAFVPFLMNNNFPVSVFILFDNINDIVDEITFYISFMKNDKLDMERVKEEMYDFYNSMSSSKKLYRKIKNDVLDIIESNNESKELLIKKYFEKEEE